MVPRKFTSYRDQGESGVVRFPGKILIETKLRFFRENAIASVYKKMWIEVECHISLVTVVSPGRRPGTTLNILYKNIIYKNVEAQIQDFYYIELRTLLNKVLRLGLEPNVLIKDIECSHCVLVRRLAENLFLFSNSLYNHDLIIPIKVWQVSISHQMWKILLRNCQRVFSYFNSTLRHAAISHDCTVYFALGD